VYNDVETLKTNTPDFDPVTTSNKFCITNTANGGTISYLTPTTDTFAEGSTNLYYTQQRVDDRINVKAGDGSLTNLVAQSIQGQAIHALSDRRLKQDIIPLTGGVLEGMHPVRYAFRSRPVETRYGFVAQDLQRTHPDLVSTGSDGHLRVNYLDTIAMLVAELQDLRGIVHTLRKDMEKISPEWA
jgi:hypothetical protein